ncbi:UNVERIFIED_CONTAM: hypothetical protein K2H54_000016 [Gekko kuhli]
MWKTASNYIDPAIIRLLFEKLPEFFHESVGSDGLSLPRLIINQLKWLDRIVDSKDLVLTVMQIICVSPLSIQHDIITSLPEILEDSQHGEVARELSSLLKEKTELTVPILDALSSLNLDMELLSEVISDLRKKLDLESCISLPRIQASQSKLKRNGNISLVLIVFLSTCLALDFPETVELWLPEAAPTRALPAVWEAASGGGASTAALKAAAREATLAKALPATTRRASITTEKWQPASWGPVEPALTTTRDTGLSANQVNISQDSVKLLFEAIKSAVKFQKTILEAWVKAIENVASASEHKVLDLIVLLIICATNVKNQKQIERVLRNKIRSGCMQEQLLQNAFRHHSQVMRDLFPAILSVAEIFLHAVDPCVVSFGSCMYKQAYAAFDSYCQQEIIGALVTHACGGNDVEVDVSLDVLVDLVSEHTSSVIPYAVFLKSILDYVDNLSPKQIRKLFHILSSLAFSQEPRSSHIQDDMHMVIRKQLSSTIAKYKCTGIIGAVTMVSSMAARRSKENGHLLEKAPLRKEQCKQITSLLELVCSCCKQVPQALALYYDELASLVQKGNLDLQILDWIEKGVVKDFEADFVAEFPPLVDGVSLLPVKALYSLEDEESEGMIVINLLPLLSQSYLSVDETADPNKEKRLWESPIRLASAALKAAKWRVLLDGRSGSGWEKEGADSVCLQPEPSSGLSSHGLHGENAGFLCALEAESPPGGPVSGENLFWLSEPAAVCNLKPGFSADH